TALFVAKATALLAYLVAVQIIAVPAFVLLLLGPSISSVPNFLALLALADIGIAIVGTLVGALAIQSRAHDLLVPLIALPLLLPVLICAAKGRPPLLPGGGAPALAARWPLTIALYDLVFGLVAYAVFDFLLED